MKHYYRQIPALLLCAILLVSCGTKKQAVSTVPTVPQPTCVTAKMSLLLSSDGKDIFVSGTLHMKHNDVIQLSLVTFGILEVGRIEMTPDYFLVIDKMNRRYVKAAYSNVVFLKRANIDFRTIQDYFWDEQTDSNENWERMDYVSVEGWKFPTRHLITIPNGSKPIKANITLSNLNTNSEWEKRTSISSRYREVSVEELFSLIMKDY